MDSESDDDTCNHQNNEMYKFATQINTRFTALKLRENNLTAKIKELEKTNECIQAQMCSYKEELRKKNCIIKEMKTILDSSKEKEILCNMHGQHNEDYSRLEEAYKCTKKELADSISHSKLMEKKYKHKLESLYKDNEVTCQKLLETDMALNEAKSIINNDIVKINNRITVISNLTTADKRNEMDMMTKIQKLKKENVIKDEELLCMKQKIKNIQQKNENYESRINELKKQLRDYKWIKSNLKTLEKNYEQLNQELDCGCFRKKLKHICQSFFTKTDSIDFNDVNSSNNNLQQKQQL